MGARRDDVRVKIEEPEGIVGFTVMYIVSTQSRVSLSVFTVIIYVKKICRKAVACNSLIQAVHECVLVSNTHADIGNRFSP